jgi:hypothetical protein
LVANDLTLIDQLVFGIVDQFDGDALDPFPQKDQVVSPIDDGVAGALDQQYRAGDRGIVLDTLFPDVQGIQKFNGELPALQRVVSNKCQKLGIR